MKFSPIFCAALALSALTALPAEAHVTGSAMQSANIQPMNGHGLDSADARQVYRDLRTTGFNTVTLDIPLFQADKAVPTITPRKAGPGTSATPTDAQLTRAIRNAQAAGLNVVLKPQLELPGGEWRAHIKGSAREQAAWTAWMVHYAKLGRPLKVQAIVIGVEQKGMSLPSGSGKRWISTVAAVRKANPKIKITYAAHTSDEAALLPKAFVAKLDYLSLTWYPRPPKGFRMPVVKDWSHPTGAERRAIDRGVATLEADMRSDKPFLDEIHSRYGKRIVFAETGFRSIDIDHYFAKGDELKAAHPDLNLQRMQYEALLHFVDGLSYVDGVMLFRVFNTPDAGGSHDLTLTWQRKPSGKVIARYFGGTVPKR